MEDNMNFKLSKPIQFSKDGGFEDSFELVLTAPTMKDRKQAGNLQQIIARAEKQEQFNMMGSLDADTIEKIQKQLDPAELEKIKAERDSDKSGIALKETILSSNEDIEVFYAAFDTLAFRVCTVDDGINLKPDHLNDMCPKDYEKMCFGYIANFIE